jgi:hypothetical protein
MQYYIKHLKSVFLKEKIGIPENEFYNYKTKSLFFLEEALKNYFNEIYTSNLAYFA